MKKLFNFVPQSSQSTPGEGEEQPDPAEDHAHLEDTAEGAAKVAPNHHLHLQAIKQKYPGAVSSKSVKDKEIERKKEMKRKPGQGPRELNLPKCKLSNKNITLWFNRGMGPKL